MDARLPEPMDFTGNLSQKFQKYLQLFEIYLVASEKHRKKSEIKVAILLNCMGKEAVKIFNTFQLTADEKKNYEKVTEEFRKYCNSKKNLFYERYVFFTKKQQKGQCIDDFLSELTQLAETCEFGEQTKSMIEEATVLGMNNIELRNKLLKNENLTFEDGLEEYRAKELSKFRYQELLKEIEEEEEIKCMDCLNWHSKKKCRAFGKRCNECGGMNHFARACKYKGLTKRLGPKYKGNVTWGKDTGSEAVISHQNNS